MQKRPYQNPDGTITMIDLPECKCNPSERRGPAGGVCWCGGAIPEAHLTQRAPDAATPCAHRFHVEDDNFLYCIDCPEKTPRHLAGDEIICACEKGFENPTKRGYCGVCGKQFHH